MFLSISAEGRIVMLVTRKSSHSQRVALEPILSQCVDHPQNFANRYKRKQENSLCLVYTAYFRTRKSEGLITRKLSVTESRRASQFRGTSRVRKVIVFVLKSRNVA